MLTQTELKILKTLFDDFTFNFTIRELSLKLQLPYPQVYRSIISLEEKKLIEINKKKRYSQIGINLEKFKEDYILVEIERKKDILHEYPILKIINKDLKRILQSQFICILFGSYAGKTAKKGSDIDLLFIIPEEYNYDKFDRIINNSILVPYIDINITTESGLLEMWEHPGQMNVGNELLKKHVILRGAEAFLNLRRNHYMGQ